VGGAKLAYGLTHGKDDRVNLAAECLDFIGRLKLRERNPRPRESGGARQTPERGEAAAERRSRAGERVALAEAMLGDVLANLRATPSVAGIIVVSADLAVHALARCRCQAGPRRERIRHQ